MGPEETAPVAHGGRAGLDLIRRIQLGEFQTPTVFDGVFDNWPAREWTPDAMENGPFSDVETKVRFASRNSAEITWESDCTYVDTTLGAFARWIRGEEVISGAPGNAKKYWGYADYKRFHEIFRGRAGLHGEGRWVDWRSIGLEDQEGEGAETTLWFGSAGSSVPCHFDTYGANLVAQLSGKKSWLLIPPGDPTGKLRPTRLPFEESSVFSRLKNLELASIPGVCNVVLEPGQLLLVPNKWWHSVTALTTSISVNTWVHISATDAYERVREGVTRAVLCALLASPLSVSVPAAQPPEDRMGQCPGEPPARLGSQSRRRTASTWLNPTEEVFGTEQDLILLAEAVRSAAASVGSSRVSHCQEEKHSERKGLDEEEGSGGIREALARAAGHPGVVACMARALLVELVGQVQAQEVEAASLECQGGEAKERGWGWVEIGCMDRPPLEQQKKRKKE